MQRIKVLYVFGGEKASGAEIVLERLINYNLNSVEPHLFIAPGKFSADLINSRRTYPITVVRRLRKLNRSSASKASFYIEAFKNYLIISSSVIGYIKKHRINYIHANTIVPASYLIPAILYCRLLGIKKQWLWSDHDLKYFAKTDYFFSRLSAHLYDKTLTVSKAVKAKYGLRKSVEVVYNGLDTQFFKPDNAIRQSFRSVNNYLESDLLLGIAGTVSPRKGQLLLAQSFKEIQTEFPHAYLVIAGTLSSDTPTYSQSFLQAIAANAQINYIGHISEMVTFYNACDVIINNSSTEGGEPLGTTIYEAMACEKIVMASKTGGTPEIIEDGVDGFVFEPDNKEALKKMLKHVVTNIRNLEIIKRNAREKVSLQFSIDAMAKKYNSLIR